MQSHSDEIARLHELAGQAIRHAAEDNHLPTPDPGAPIYQQIREVLEAFSAQVATFTEGRDRWRERAKRAESELAALKKRFHEQQNLWNTVLGEAIERERNVTR